MIEINVDFDTIREKLFDLVDEAIDAASEAVDKFNDAFAGDRVDIESQPFTGFGSYYGG